MENLRNFGIKVWNQNKILLIAIITIAILFFPIGFIHELGHILVCTANGFDYTLTLGSLALIVHCSDTPQPVLWYFALGGMFGMSASLTLFIPKQFRENKGIFIGISVTAFDHFLKAVSETFAHSAYISNTSFFLFMTVVLLVFMTALIWFFSKRPAKIT